MLFSRLRALIYPKKDQKFYKFLSHLCCPCLHLYEIVLKYYSKYAYIYLAIFAKPYTISAKESYFLLLRNGKRIKDPLSSSFYSIFMIKLTISLAGFIVCYVLMILTDFMDLGFEKNAVTSRLGPSIFALVISIYVAQIIGGCMEASVSSMIICGACDEEMFSREQRFIEKDFQTALDNVVEEQTEQNKDDRENFDVHKPGHSNRVPANLVKFNDKQDVIWPNSYLGISNRDTDRSVSKIASRIESQDKKILTMKPIGRIETAENKVIRRNDETIHIIDEKSVEFDELKYPPSLIPKDTRFPAYRANLNYNAW